MSFLRSSGKKCQYPSRYLAIGQQFIHSLRSLVSVMFPHKKPGFCLVLVILITDKKSPMPLPMSQLKRNGFWKKLWSLLVAILIAFEARTCWLHLASHVYTKITNFCHVLMVSDKTRYSKRCLDIKALRKIISNTTISLSQYDLWFIGID